MGEFEAELEEYMQQRKGNVMSFFSNHAHEKEEKPGFFSKLFNGKKESIHDVKTDLKDVAKIALSVMKKLPPEEVEAFKKSADYAYFREILQKHEMIK